MPSPAFSVVVPAYNAKRTIGPTIKSILAQTLEDFELIVVDDGSDDETPEIVSSFGCDGRLRLIKQANQGTAGARNTGIGAAHGESIAFLDHDDLWMPRYLEAVAAAFATTPDAGFAYVDGWLLDDATGRLRRRTSLQLNRAPSPPPKDPLEFLSRLIERTFIRSATTIRRAVLDEVGNFDADLSGVDDFDLWARILLAGYGGAQAPGIQVIFRDHSRSLSKNALRMCTGRREVLRRIAEDYDAPPKVVAAAIEQIPVLDRFAATLTGQRKVHWMALRCRLALGRLQRWILAKRRTTSMPPPAVAAVLREYGAA